MSAAQHLLDQVQSIARLDALAAEPGAYADRLAAELAEPEAEPADERALAHADAQLALGLARIDAMIERAARLRFDHVLADDSSLPAATRKVFATTILGYADRVELLEARVRDVAARGGARDPERVAMAVGDAARDIHALRSALRDAVLSLIRARATAAAARADQPARDRRLDDDARRRWSAVRRELEAVAADPARIALAPFAARVAEWPAQIDDASTPEPTFADMIELD